MHISLCGLFIISKDLHILRKRERCEIVVLVLAGIMPPACQRSVFVLSAGMLVFGCKIFQINDVNEVFASLPMSDVSNCCGSDATLHFNVC